jgi:low affinity Fe/Cu permease
MKKFHILFEAGFAKVSHIGTVILSNSYSFVIAIILVFFWLFNRDFYPLSVNDFIRDFIHGASFLSLFIIQKSFNHFSAALHLKVNEIVSPNHLSNNTVLNAEKKTEQEIEKLQKEYTDLANHGEEH